MLNLSNKHKLTVRENPAEKIFWESHRIERLIFCYLLLFATFSGDALWGGLGCCINFFISGAPVMTKDELQ